MKLKHACPLFPQTLVNRWLGGGWFGGGFKLGANITGEYIVNPNHALQAKTAEDLAKKDKVAKLAWVIVYDLSSNGVPSPDHKVQVWIDEQTKEVIGGDLH